MTRGKGGVMKQHVNSAQGGAPVSMTVIRGKGGVMKQLVNSAPGGGPVSMTLTLILGVCTLDF